ncbi:MAG TPA: hypothetical protein VIV57_02595 [Anaeromyxobacter sp.]
MLRLALAAALALPLSVRAEPPPAEGRILTDEGTVEILGRPVRVGERVDLPEGWFRVEEPGTEDSQVGSFAVVPVETFAALGAPAVTETAEATDPGQTRQRARDCRAERSAYLSELWRQSGIEFSSPAALIDALEGRTATGPAMGFYWFAKATDPFRPLAWSSALRDRAEALARCARGD